MLAISSDWFACLPKHQDRRVPVTDSTKDLARNLQGVNQQCCRCTIFARVVRFDIVKRKKELAYYKHDIYEIVIPKIFGDEVKKDLATRASTKLWNWDLFKQRLEFGEDEVAAAQQIIDWAGNNKSPDESVEPVVQEGDEERRTADSAPSSGELDRFSQASLTRAVGFECAAPAGSKSPQLLIR